MALRAETAGFLRELERVSGRTLNYPEEVGFLVEAATEHGTMDQFNDAIFLAKFITRSSGVMKRIGVGGEGYEKLSTEFQSNIQKAAVLLRSMFDLAPEEVKRISAPFFFSLTQESLEHLMLLLMDLTLVKNWILDGNTLPRLPVS